jgi:Rieske Fe-S protein
MGESSQNNWSRREVLRALASSVLGLPLAGCVTRGATWADAKTHTPRLKDMAVGTAVLLKNEKAILWRDGQGIAAISALCPHRGCAVRIVRSRLVCPCHGSRFTRSGKLLRGPARRGLAWFRVTFQGDGRLTVHPGQPVPAGTYLRVS